MKRILAIVLCLLFVLSLAACGGDKKQDKTHVETEVSSEATVVVTLNPEEIVEENPDAVPDDKYATVSDLINDPVNAQVINQLVDEMGGEEGFTIAVVAKDNNLTYEFRISDDVFTEGFDDVFITAIETAMEKGDSEFQGIVDSLDEMVVEDGTTMTVVYYKPDGSELYRKDYVASK